MSMFLDGRVTHELMASHVHPVLLGRGRPLSRPGGHPSRLRLPVA